MTSTQESLAYENILGWFQYDWVQLPAVINFVNEAVGFDAHDIVTREARDFVAKLIEEDKVVVGSLSSDGRFVAWSGSKEEQLDRVLAEMQLGAPVRNELLVWFDQPKKEPNQTPDPTAPSRRGSS